jgi:hypothetical protein
MQVESREPRRSWPLVLLFGLSYSSGIAGTTVAWRPPSGLDELNSQSTCDAVAPQDSRLPALNKILPYIIF